MEYSDDISVISSDNHKTVKSERDNTNKLSKKGLSINDTKTERYTINRNNNSWKKCKLLGSLLDTDEEIKRRKSLVINAANNLEHLFKNKHLTTSTKMKVNQYSCTILNFGLPTSPTTTRKTQNNMDIKSE